MVPMTGFNVKASKMLTFLLVAEAYGQIYPHPSGEDSSFVVFVTPSSSPGAVSPKISFVGTHLLKKFCGVCL